MRQVLNGLYVGTIEDVEFAKQAGMSILGACKEPLHRKNARLQGANFDGYRGRSMAKTEPEYLYAEREHALYLNLIDAREAKYIPDEIINKALDFIDKELREGRNILIACNQAESRSPSIVLMWMIKCGYFHECETFEDVVNSFTDGYYYRYNPGDGMKAYVEKFWREY